MTRGFLRGVLLPQIARQSGWTAEEFLAQVCRKAGLGPEGWREAGAIVEVFSAQVFGEIELEEVKSV